MPQSVLHRLSAFRAVFLLTGLALGCTLPGAAGAADGMVGVLADITPEKRERFSCSVYFTGRGNRDVLYERGQTGRVYMNIRGQTIQGSRLESTERSPMKAGERFSTLYQFGSVKVRLDSRVTSACPPGTRACELMRFTGTLTATDGAATETHGVNGACGV